ncbi:MAG: hypothetical protein O2894_08625, partial [Planctomycetota bacterium]|nr:hypothetical protein [Planctomycetota bacterium]
MHRLRPILLLLILLPLLVAGGACAEEDAAAPDAFAAALRTMGLTEADLGYRPQAHWPRYPHPRTVPYVMPFFEDLLAHPLDTYAFTRSLGNAVEDLLTPELLRAAPTDTARGVETLHKLGIMLATERRIGGFRVFGLDTSGLRSEPAAERPLEQALRAAWAAGSADAAPEIDVSAVPASLQRPLAALVLDLLDARTWIERGLRRVPPGVRAAVRAALPRLAESTPDGETYFPALDDAARAIDEHSLHGGCLKALQAVQDARRALGALETPESGWPPFAFRLATGLGDVVFDAGSRDVLRVEDPFLVVRFDARGATEGPLGATAPHRLVSVGLLMGGEGPIGTPAAIDVQAEEAGRAVLASGVFGCGLVYAAGDGAHQWRTGRWGLGAGLFGLGALVDEGGDDTYSLAAVGQGAAFFGAGLLLDAAGDDRYDLREGDGQGFGGPGGVGVLADRSGNDRYVAEPDAKKAGRADYHSEGRIAVSNAQGVGSGRRGDISDGHVWAGGLGALLDVDGDDVYEAGNFSQGLGYWYGTGILWDGGGNDRYRSVYFTRGSGAHFAIGALVDESGDDQHELWDTAGAALAFGWDVVNAFLIDRGSGNDTYEAQRISFGVAQVRSQAFFIDEGGDDTYVVRGGGHFLGDVDDRDAYRVPGRTSDFPWRLAQVGVFLDLGGQDHYHVRAADDALTPHTLARDNAVWQVRAREPAKPGAGAPNCSYAADVERGIVGWLASHPARAPPK